MSIGWYSKNYFLFGFFGSSSWAGINLWKVASANYTGDQLESLVNENVLQSTVVDVDVFSKPSAYVERGFDATTDIEVLSRDDYNNINIVDISNMYKSNAVELIMHDPVHYLRTVLQAYILFSSPSSRFKHHPLNVAKIRIHEGISSQILQGQALQYRTGYRFGSFLFFVLPASMVFYFVVPIQACGTSIKKWIDYVREDSAMFFTAFLILYTTSVGCLLEIGENTRFKFLVEQLIWAFAISGVYRYIHRRPLTYKLLR